MTTQFLIIIVLVLIYVQSRILRKRANRLHDLVNEKIKECKIQDLDLFRNPEVRRWLTLKSNLEIIRGKIKLLLNHQGEMYFHFNWKHSSSVKKLEYLEEAFDKIN